MSKLKYFLVGDEQKSGFIHGFLSGLFILIFFAISLFAENVELYQVHNNGRAYKIGYFLGLICLMVYR